VPEVLRGQRYDRELVVGRCRRAAVQVSHRACWRLAGLAQDGDCFGEEVDRAAAAGVPLEPALNDQ
jgi:hypothetical protein